MKFIILILISFNSFASVGEYEKVEIPCFPDQLGKALDTIEPVLDLRYGNIDPPKRLPSSHKRFEKLENGLKREALKALAPNKNEMQFKGVGKMNSGDYLVDSAIAPNAKNRYSEPLGRWKLTSSDEAQRLGLVEVELKSFPNGNYVDGIVNLGKGRFKFSVYNPQFSNSLGELRKLEEEVRRLRKTSGLDLIEIQELKEYKYLQKAIAKKSKLMDEEIKSFMTGQVKEVLSGKQLAVPLSDITIYSGSTTPSVLPKGHKRIDKLSKNEKRVAYKLATTSSEKVELLPVMGIIGDSYLFDSIIPAQPGQKYSKHLGRWKISLVNKVDNVDGQFDDFLTIKVKDFYKGDELVRIGEGSHNFTVERPDLAELMKRIQESHIKQRNLSGARNNLDEAQGLKDEMIGLEAELNFRFKRYLIDELSYDLD